LAFAPVDAFHLAVGLPVLVGAMEWARRGRLAGLLSWPGALLYVLYNFALNLAGVPFGALFLPYVLLLTLSAYTTIALVASIDGDAVRRRLAGAVPARGAGAFLVILTSLFIAMAVGGVVGALVDGRPTTALERMLWIGDLTTIAPACLVGGILLWQRKALGYTAGMGLLLAYGLLFLGLVPAMVFPALYDGSPVDIVGLALMAVLGAASLALWALFVRGAARPVSARGRASVR
jgi:hypothetical protein